MDKINPILDADMKYVISADLPWERFRNKTILITGASGFLPAYMIETLLYLNDKRKLSCKVFGLVRNLEKAKLRFKRYLGNSNLVLILGDVSEKQLWSERFDYIIHAASQASPKYYGVDPVGTMAANLQGSIHLLNYAKERGCDGFLFFSSGDVYGMPRNIPTKEADYGYIEINDVRSCYCESKRAAETLGVCYAKQYGVPFKTVRPSHTYGPGMALDDGRVFADLVRDVLHENDLMLHSEGTAIRTFCYLSDATVGFFTVLLKGAIGSSYNLGNPDGVLSIRELAEILSNLGLKNKLNVKISTKKPNEYLTSPVSIVIPNVDLLNSLGWHPKISPKEGFERTLNYFRWEIDNNL